MQAHTIQRNSLVYEEAGQGPAVLLLHDLPLNRQMWRAQIETISRQGYRVIAPDLRGFGDNPTAGKTPSLTAAARDILALLRYLGIGRAVMVGSGMAASLIREIMQRQPRRVAAVCLLAPSTRPAGVDSDICGKDLAEMVREGHKATAIDVLIDKLLPECRPLHIQEIGWQVQGWLEKLDEATLTGSLALTGEQFVATCQRPVLVLHGSRTTGLSAEAVLQGSNIHDEIVAGAGLLLNIEQPERVNRCLLDFLNWLNLAKPRHELLARAA
ncbi:MAG: alpha/beta hydrolase [Desulfuromonadales bacterium]|nr:alpha/beta hydrolase [Desulfuromonadales bacterium]